MDFLLKHGITWNEFGEISKEAYVKAARDDYGIQGRPTNNSRVAMMTGRQPHRNGMGNTAVDISGFGLAGKEVTLAEVLSENGYNHCP